MYLYHFRTKHLVWLVQNQQSRNEDSYASWFSKQAVILLSSHTICRMWQTIANGSWPQAISFYKKQGFAVLDGNSYGCSMGIRL